MGRIANCELRIGTKLEPTGPVFWIRAGHGRDKSFHCPRQQMRFRVRGHQSLHFSTIKHSVLIMCAGDYAIALLNQTRSQRPVSPETRSTFQKIDSRSRRRYRGNTGRYTSSHVMMTGTSKYSTVSDYAVQVSTKVRLS